MEIKDKNIKKAQEIILKVLKIEMNEDFDNLSIDNCTNWNSLNHMALMAEISDIFGFNFSGDEIIELTSVDKIIEFIKENA